MSQVLTQLQKRLCNILQDGLPISQKPFAAIAQSLDSDEDAVLHEIKALKETGIIRRIGASINYAAMGKVSTLVTAHIPEEKLGEIAEAVNAIENVSHNYHRRHYYNMWFTLQGDSVSEIEDTITELSGRFGVEFHSLPVKRYFKLDVRFDAEQMLPAETANVERITSTKVVELDTREKKILSKLQNGIEIIAEPFKFLRDEKLKMDEVLEIIQGLIDKGVIRRIAAVMEHRKLGFTANVLFVCKVDENKIEQAGNALARFGAVSHCYERKTFEGWPYNLFAMMHGRNMGDIQHIIDKFTKSQQIDSFELLPTITEFKKQPVRYRF